MPTVMAARPQARRTEPVVEGSRHGKGARRPCVAGVVNRAARVCVTSAVMLFAVLGAWRIITHELPAAGPWDASRALLDHPMSPLAPAGQEPAPQSIDGKTAARRLLAVEPLKGDAFTTVADSVDVGATATELHRIAVRRAPRQAAPRVWLINDALHGARFDDAMEHIDVLLRLNPAYRAYVYPRLAELALDPAFAIALAHRLKTMPMWRAEFVQTLQAAPDASAAARTLDRLASQGALGPDERKRWIDGLLARGRWDQAYLRWAAASRRGSAPLAAVYNGDFSRTTTDTGFDWRLLNANGVELDFDESVGSRGRAAHAVFRGRPSEGVNLRHPLELAPARYQLWVRMRAQALHGENGLAWSLACDSGEQLLRTDQPVEGTFEWRTVTMDLEVPAAGCPGQWLRLVNPAPAGAAQHLSGEIWFDDVRITRAPAQRTAVVATFRGMPGAAMKSQGADFVDATPGTRLAAGDRLLLVAETGARVVFDNGCEQALQRPGIYRIDEAACASAMAPSGGEDAVAAQPHGVVPDLEVLRSAEAWKALPIGR